MSQGIQQPLFASASAQGQVSWLYFLSSLRPVESPELLLQKYNWNSSMRLVVSRHIIF